MTILFWSLFLTSIAFTLHLILWKIRIPKRQTKTLLGLFFLVLILGLLILATHHQSFRFMGMPAPHDFLEYLHIFWFFISITLAYMITYSAIEADSPSLVMVMVIAKAGQNGLDKEVFEHSMNDDILVKPRISDLLLDKMVCKEGNKYHLTQKGVLFARIFILHRKLLGAQKGG